MLEIRRSKEIFHRGEYFAELNFEEYSLMVSNRRGGFNQYKIFQKTEWNE